MIECFLETVGEFVFRIVYSRFFHQIACPDSFGEALFEVHSHSYVPKKS